MALLTFLGVVTAVLEELAFVAPPLLEAARKIVEVLGR